GVQRVRRLRIRSPRHARAVPGMRDAAGRDAGARRPRLNRAHRSPPPGAVSCRRDASAEALHARGGGDGGGGDGCDRRGPRIRGRRRARCADGSVRRRKLFTLAAGGMLIRTLSYAVVLIAGGVARGAEGPAAETVWMEAETFGPLHGRNFSYQPAPEDDVGGG